MSLLQTDGGIGNRLKAEGKGNKEGKMLITTQPQSGECRKTDRI
jgi:hypothetical protein